MRKPRLATLATFSSIIMCKSRFFPKKKNWFWALRHVSVATVTFYEIILQILCNNSRHFWNIFQEFRQYSSRLSDIFPKVFLNFFVIFQNNSWNFPEYCAKFFKEIFPKIFSYVLVSKLKRIFTTLHDVYRIN